MGAKGFTPEAVLGDEAWGSPEGKASLEEPLAGRRLISRWDGSVRLQCQEWRTKPFGDFFCYGNF